MHGAAQAEAMSRNPSGALSSKVRAQPCLFQGWGHGRPGVSVSCHRNMRLQVVVAMLHHIR